MFGSVLAYTAYTWVLQHASVSRVSTYAYVNPVVAIVLGAAILNETIDIWILLGAAIIVVSVALVIRSEARRIPADTPTGTPTDAAGAVADGTLPEPVSAKYSAGAATPGRRS